MGKMARNAQTAYRWLRGAAKKGNTDAMFAVSRMLRGGEGVEKRERRGRQVYVQILLPLLTSCSGSPWLLNAAMPAPCSTSTSSCVVMEEATHKNLERCPSDGRIG